MILRLSTRPYREGSPEDEKAKRVQTELESILLDTTAKANHDLAETITARVVAALQPMLDQSPRATQPRLLTIEQAAAYIGRKPSAIRSLEHKGLLPAVRGDSRIMFDIRDLDAWIEANKSVSTI